MNLITSTLISILFFCFALGYFINRFVISKALKYNLKKSNITAIRWESQSKPIFGGISFYAIFILMLIYYIFTFGVNSSTHNYFLVYTIVITLSFFMGLADDLLNTSPYFKFIIQFINAALLIYFGIYIQISSIEWINYLITIFWVVGIMNSINMLDNMDAISTMTTIIIFIGIIVMIFLGGMEVNNFTVFLLIGMIGSFLSFLVFFNWNPSKMYMGDNGSQFIGSLLAITGILFFWNSNNHIEGILTLKPVLVTVLAFLVPIVDTSIVTINRLAKGKSPFVGGRDHTTHFLSYAGLTDRGVVIFLSFITLVSISASIYMILKVKVLSNFAIYSSIIFIIIVFSALFTMTKVIKPKI